MNRKKLYPWYFASGAALLFFLLCFLPGIIGIAYSFTDWNNFTNEIRFVGLDNYKRIFEGNSEYLLYIKKNGEGSVEDADIDRTVEEAHAALDKKK